jgi:hypothetical protein
MLLLSLALLAFGCERRAQTDNPQHYDKAGLQFDYPGNWEVTQDETDQGMRILLIESPGDAIYIIQIYPSADELPLDEFARAFAQAAAAETPIATLSASTFSAIRSEGKFEVLVEKLQVKLMGLRVPHTRTYHMARFGDSQCIFIAQVADEDKKDVTPGFDQIVGSFQYAAG